MEAQAKLKELDEQIAQIQNELKDVHGTETEVYARIVGYYRAVRNWNKGKADEFKSRRMFEITDRPVSHAPVAQSGEEGTEREYSPDCGCEETLTYELYARKTCPNCPPVKEYMAGLKIEGRNIDVDTEEGLAMAASKGVFAAPTVIFYDAQGGEMARAHSVSELEEIFSSVVA